MIFTFHQTVKEKREFCSCCGKKTGRLVRVLRTSLPGFCGMTNPGRVEFYLSFSSLLVTLRPSCSALRK